MSNILPNGTVLPSGLLGNHGRSALVAGFNQSYKNTGLKAGFIVNAYAPDDPNNKNKLCSEYDVQTVEQNENRGITTILYRNCLSTQGFGSIADFFEFTLRPMLNKTVTGFPTFSGQDGAVVLIRCLNDLGDKAIIHGYLIHPDRPTTITSTDPHLAFTYNGIAFKIATDGSLSLVFNGATDSMGEPTDSSQGTTTLTIENDGSFQIMNSNNVTVRLDKQGDITISTQKDVNVNCDNVKITASGDADIESSGTATIEGQTVNLGKNASEAVIKGKTFKDYLDQQFIVATAMGPSGNSIVPVPASALSTKVETE